MPSSRAGRAAAAAVALLGVLGTTAVAEAATAGSATGTTSASSARWAAVPTDGTTAPTGTGPLALTFARMSGGNGSAPPAQYLSVFNTGTLDLTGATYGVTSTSTTGEVPVLERCTATWNEAVGTCLLGTITTVPTGTSTTVAPQVVGSSVRLRVRFTRNVSAGTTVTVSSQVSRTQARLATTTRS